MALSQGPTSVETNCDNDLHHHQLGRSPLPQSWHPGHTKKGQNDNGKGNGNRHRHRSRTANENEDEAGNSIGAFKVARAKRILQIITAIIYCLASAGIIFGYAALKPVLILERVYRELCTPSEISRHVRVCVEQEIRLNLMFVVAAVGTNVAALPVGALLDNYGPLFCASLGSLFLFLGAGLLSLASAGTFPEGFDGFIAGYLGLALGGSSVFLSCFHLSNSFPRYSGSILALLTGSFDSSSAVFLLYRLLYRWSEGRFKPSSFFTFYLLVPAFVVVAQILWMPKKGYETVVVLGKEIEDEAESANGIEAGNEYEYNDESRLYRGEEVIDGHIAVDENTLLITQTNQRQHILEEEKNLISGVWGVMHGKTIAQQIFSPWFVLITLFTVLQMTRINYFMATIFPQYEYLLSSRQKAEEINAFFDIALPLGGAISIPFIGLILDNTSTIFVLSLLVILASISGTLGTLHFTWAAYTNVSLFVLYRPFFYTAISDYAAKVFGFANFGIVYGLIICFSGLFNFSQSGLDKLLHGPFGGNPIPLNLCLVSATLLLGLTLCGYVGFRARNIKRERLEVEAEQAVEEIMPGARDTGDEDEEMNE